MDPREVPIPVSFMEFYRAYCKANGYHMWTEVSMASAKAIWRLIERKKD